MRSLLGVLDSERDPRALAPQPGLADVQDRVSRARASGLATDLHVDGEPATVSAALDLCAYRIVQEALTNAIKHAAPARAEVHLCWGQSVLELEISAQTMGVVRGLSTAPRAGTGSPGCASAWHFTAEASIPEPAPAAGSPCAPVSHSPRRPCDERSPRPICRSGQLAR